MMQGATPEVVERALASKDPLPGTRGFAGRLPDGRLVRDVLGRYPLYSAADDPREWAFDPARLAEPERVPAGHVRTPEGDERVWTLPGLEPEGDDETAIAAVREAIEASVADAAAEGSTAVAFSGGVDSAAVAAGIDGPLYVAGFPDSHDLAAAREAASAVGRDLTSLELSHADLERAVRAVARATGRTNAMDVSIAVPLYLVAERARADGYDRLAVGQGADELFGGYAKVAKAPDDHRLVAETVRGARDEVLATLPDQLPRDVLAIRAAGIEPVAPLLDDRVVAAALRLPDHLLVRGEERKVALREAMRGRLPASVVDRDKKAMQYGSLVARELDRMARQNGFKRKIGDHVDKYVASLL
jgi:asparagine synthase (glutamine-hydrolysing)